MRKLVWLFLAIGIALEGCAQFGWVKDDVTPQEASRDTYACLREAQQRVSGAPASLYGGFAEYTVITDPGQYHVCMAAHGYSWRPL